MTSIQGSGRFGIKCTFKNLLGSLSILRSNHNNFLVDFLIVYLIIRFFGPLIAKYTEKNLQKILKTILEAQAPSFNSPCEKLLKAISSDIYCDKSHMEYYKFH